MRYTVPRKLGWEFIWVDASEDEYIAYVRAAFIDCHHFGVEPWYWGA